MKPSELAVWSLVALLLYGGSVPVLWAAEFRSIQPISKPIGKSTRADGAEAVAEPVPVARGAIESATRELLAAWNAGDLEGALDEEFFDKSRLLDAVDERVPRDATIRLLGVQGSQTLEQYERMENGVTILESVVSVTATTQMEFTDASMGFRQLRGMNEFVLRIEQRADGSGQ